MEEWKEIVGFSNYQVSNFGNVKSKRGSLTLTQNHDGYIRVGLYHKGVRKAIFVHRLVAYAFLPLSDKKEIDHINRIKTDNRVENLRWVDRSVNARNVAKNPNCSSKYIGVHLSKSNKWKSSIHVNKKVIYLGRFETEEEAGLAYDNYIIQNIKDFGILNFPERLKK